MLKRVAGGRKLIGLIVVAGALVAPQAASAAINSALGLSCAVQGDGVRFCGSSSPRSTVASPVDGVPIDVNVAFPPAPAAGADGKFPLVMLFHGYGGEKAGLTAMHRWLDRGYATFSMTDRGFHESCGSAASRTAAGAACDDGYVRLIDNRYEVREAQDFAGLLADEGVGLIDPQRIGAVGGSYGGGLSMALGALKNRVVNLNYSISPWQSPAGKPMQIAAAAPNIPWSDLAYSLMPNGSTLDYVADAPYLGRLGVEKQSFVSALYLSGQGAPGYYATAGSDPTADLTGWRDTLNAGEPYGVDVLAILGELTLHHSSYYLDHSVQPAPMLMSSGFTDDLFPADETIRFYNRTKTQYPDANLALFYGDFGHMRGQGKADATGALRAKEEAWLDYFIKGQGAKPAEGVTAYTQTCPGSAPSGGPFTSSNWATIAPGEIVLDDRTSQTIAPDSSTNGDFNPVPAGNPCTTSAAIDKPGAAVYRLDEVPDGGYTLMGSVSVLANYDQSEENSQVAARLLDVAPDGTETLIARGLWRPSFSSGRQVFQLHPNGYRFEAGHVPKLELLAADGVRPADPPLYISSYGRPSDGQKPVRVSGLQVRMPVVERPGALGGVVKAPQQKFLPQGYQLAKDFADLPPTPSVGFAGRKFKQKRKNVKARVSCPAEFDSCNDGSVRLYGSFGAKKKDGKRTRRRVSLKASFDSIPAGQVSVVKVRLDGKTRRHLQKVKKMRLSAYVSSAEVDSTSRAKALLVAQKKKHKGGKSGGGGGGKGGSGGKGGGK